MLPKVDENKSSPYLMPASWFSCVDNIIAPAAEQAASVYTMLVNEFLRVYGAANMYSVEPFLTTIEKNLGPMWDNRFIKLGEHFYGTAQGVASGLSNDRAQDLRRELLRCERLQFFQNQWGKDITEIFQEKLGRPALFLHKSALNTILSAPNSRSDTMKS